MTKETLAQYGITASDFQKDDEGEYLMIDGVRYSFMQVVAIKLYLEYKLTTPSLKEFEVNPDKFIQPIVKNFSGVIIAYLVSQIWNWQTTRNHRGTHTEIEQPKMI